VSVEEFFGRLDIPSALIDGACTLGGWRLNLLLPLGNLPGLVCVCVLTTIESMSRVRKPIMVERLWHCV
jgi:hypothetical protein